MKKLELLPDNPKPGDKIKFVAKDYTNRFVGHGWRVKSDYTEGTMELTYVPVKVLFLDFDEVMTSATKLTNGTIFDPMAVALINKVCQENNTKVVVSSVWKSHMRDTVTACKMMDAIGFNPGTLYSGGSGYIDDLGYWSWLEHEFASHRTEGDGFRGEAIDLFLERHPEVSSYVIVDDSSDFFEHQMERFVHIDGINGFGGHDYMLTDYLLKDGEVEDYVLSAIHPGLRVGAYLNFTSYGDKFYRGNILDYHSENHYQTDDVFKLEDGTILKATRAFLAGEPIMLTGHSPNCKVIPMDEYLKGTYKRKV